MKTLAKYNVCNHCVIGEKTFKNMLTLPGKLPGRSRNGPPGPKIPKFKFISRGSVNGRVTRSSQLLNIPLFKTKFGQRSFHYRIVTLWNELRSSLELTDSLSGFKL